MRKGRRGGSTAPTQLCGRLQEREARPLPMNTHWRAKIALSRHDPWPNFIYLPGGYPGPAALLHTSTTQLAKRANRSELHRCATVQPSKVWAHATIAPLVKAARPSSTAPYLHLPESDLPLPLALRSGSSARHTPAGCWCWHLFYISLSLSTGLSSIRPLAWHHHISPSI